MQKEEKIILGIKISDISWEDIFDEIEILLQGDKQHFIFTPNPEICLLAQKNPRFKSALNQATINAPDGFGLKIGALILGQSLKNRITGSDLTEKISTILKNTGKSAFFLGAMPGVAKRAAQIIQEKHPAVKIGHSSGLAKSWMQDNKLFYDSQENEKVLAKIRAFAPDMLFVAYDMGAQELWIKENLHKLPSVKIALGIGGSFDFLAGKIKRAPKIFRKLGLEWLFRFLMEPRKRLRRILQAVLIFPWKCLRWRLDMANKFQPAKLFVVLNEQGKILLVKSRKLGEHWQLPIYTDSVCCRARPAVIAPPQREKQSLRCNELQDDFNIKPEQIITIKTNKKDIRAIWPKWAKLFWGFQGEEYTVHFLKLTKPATDLQLNKEAGNWTDAQWVEREMLLDKLHPIRREVGEKILKLL